VILAFRRGDDEERGFWRRVLEDLDQDEAGEDLARAQALMTRHGALDDTVKRARHYGDRARDALAIFPESPVKSALLDIVAFCIDRAY
jgi:octaprenyl-diphosphate synthase